MNLTKHIADILERLHLSPFPRDLKFYYEPSQQGTLIFIRETPRLVTSPEEADAVLRKAFFVLGKRIRVSKNTDYANVILFLYGISGDMNTHPDYLWNTPDGFLQLIKDNKQLVFLENEYFMCAAQCGEPPTFLYQRFYFALGKWLFRNFDATATGHLIEIKDGLVFLSKMPRVAV